MTRFANEVDIPFMTSIYNQGVEDKLATLETKLRNDVDTEKWLLERNQRHKVIVIEDLNKKIVGWASLNLFSPRECYQGVADMSVYVERGQRGKGIGKKLLVELIKIAGEQDFYKIVLNTMNENKSAQKLYSSLGFTVVGIYKNHGRKEGRLIDIVVMEKHIQ